MTITLQIAVETDAPAGVIESTVQVDGDGNLNHAEYLAALRVVVTHLRAYTRDYAQAWREDVAGQSYAH